MAITGIDTIEGKQIIAAGAVSAKSAEMAYNDENGNPITGYLTAVPEGYATTADLTGKQDTLTFGYNESNAISSINESAIAGGGSAPTYGYTDNGLISSIDTSGLYATSALEAESANAVKDHGTLGYDLSSYLSQNTSYFYWMPANSPWTTADYATGIFSPLQYATGACLAMDNPATFKGYFKGNEWFIANTVSTVGQMLRGEVHRTRGVHISGATTAGYGFDLNINAVSGINSTGSWKYGNAEDEALRAVSSCDMHESAFSYDASDNITAYNGSAFKAGDEFPQSATEAIETVTANSADWNGTTETVSSNSGAWGGSALPISAGPGIKFEMVNDTLVASTDETVLWEGTATSASWPITLSESTNNFESFKIDWCPYTEASNWTAPYDTVSTKLDNGTMHLLGQGLSDNSTYAMMSNLLISANDDTLTKLQFMSITMHGSIMECGSLEGYKIYKVVGINRIAGE